jgi:hypothetical protein
MEDAAMKEPAKRFLVTIDPGDAVNQEDIYQLIREVTGSKITVVPVRQRRVIAIESIGEVADR